MSHQVEYYNADRRGWWERLFESLVAKKEGDMELQLPPDSLFNGSWNAGASSIADVPEKVKAQIREEAVLDAFNRLESSLRLLLYATTPDKEPPSQERYQQILSVWRYELEHRVNLTPDTYCGAVQKYGPGMDAAYTVDGRCEPGDLLRIRVPCWRMNDRVVVRGEAELVDSNEEAPSCLRFEAFDAPAESAQPSAGPTQTAPAYLETPAAEASGGSSAVETRAVEMPSAPPQTVAPEPAAGDVPPSTGPEPDVLRVRPRTRRSSEE
jgi:hypothetical protein